MTEPPLNLEHGFTVSVYFPPGSDPDWVSDFLSRVAADAYSMPSDTLDAFVVGHAGDVLGIDEERAEADRYADMVNAPLRPETITAIAERTKPGDFPIHKVRARVHDMGRERAEMVIPDDELQPLLALADAPEPPTEERQQEALAHVHDAGTDHWGGRWAWRCDGHQHCTGDISLGHLTQDAAAGSYVRHVDECHGAEPTEKQLHARRACPGWEYDTTEGPRKTWDDVDRPPEGDGWERNTDAGRDGWERFDYTEESYWRRRVVSGPR